MALIVMAHPCSPPRIRPVSSVQNHQNAAKNMKVNCFLRFFLKFYGISYNVFLSDQHMAFYEVFCKLNLRRIRII
jgi:hypothetical protein